MNTRQSMQLNPLWQYISGLYNINFDVDIDFFFKFIQAYNFNSLGRGQLSHRDRWYLKSGLKF